MHKTSLLTKTLFLCCISAVFPEPAYTDTLERYTIGSHGQGNVIHPNWFKQSLLDLQGDLEDARAAGKHGIIIMFSQKNCSHCQAFIEITFQDKKTFSRVQKNYDVIGLDIFNDNELTYIDGTTTTVKNFAETIKARLTPTLLFIGVENRILAKIVGLYPPEKFNRVLDYIEGGHFDQMTLHDYMQKNRPVKQTSHQTIKYDPALFEKPPVSLLKVKPGDRRFSLVVFEQPNCEPCQRFHTRVLKDIQVRNMMNQFHAIQLDATDDTSQVTISPGHVTTANKWAKELELNYDIAVIFFDARGKEVHRIDSESGKDRMLGSMQYVLEKGYLRHEQFLQWRKEQAIKARNLH